MKNHLFFGISEIDVIQYDISFKFFVSGRIVGFVIMLPCPKARTFFAFPDNAVLLCRINKSNISFVAFNGFVEKFEYSVGTRKRHDYGIKLLRNLHYRHIYVFVKRKITAECSDCKSADSPYRKETADYGNDNKTQIAELSVNGSERIDKLAGV